MEDSIGNANPVANARDENEMAGSPSSEVEQPETCAICLEHVWEGSRTPCNHVFHKECINGWLSRNMRHPTCPICVRPCWPNSVDHHYAFVAFIGVVDGNGNPISLEDVISQHEEVGVHGEDENDVVWVMDIPASASNDGGGDDEPEVQWVMDIPAGGAGEVHNDGNGSGNGN